MNRKCLTRCLGYYVVWRVTLGTHWRADCLMGAYLTIFYTMFVKFIYVLLYSDLILINWANSNINCQNWHNLQNFTQVKDVSEQRYKWKSIKMDVGLQQFFDSTKKNQIIFLKTTQSMHTRCYKSIYMY